jgi:hypothetical protein
LTAGITYHYKTYTSGSDVTPWPEITFTTAPAATVPGFTFIAFGDSRPSTNSSPPSQGALDVAAEMERHSFDLLLHTGDIVNAGGICSGNHVLFRGQTHAEKVASGFRGNFPAFYRESQAKSGIDFLEMNRAK